MVSSYRFNLLIVVIASIWHIAAYASPCAIVGTASGSAGSVISISIDADPISKERILLTSVEVDSDEHFRLEFDLSETRLCYVNVNRCEALIYVRPGAKLRVTVPAKDAATFIRFDSTPIELELDANNSDSLNLWIRAFNAEYAAFIADYYVDYALNHYGEAKDQLRRLKDRDRKSDLFHASRQEGHDTLAKPVFLEVFGEFQQWVGTYFKEPMRDAFFQDYVEFSFGELESATGLSRYQVYEKYLMSRQLPWFNPAFIVFLETFYSSVVEGQPDDIQFLLTRKVNIEHDPMAAIELLKSDSIMQSGALAQAALMFHLKACYFKNRFTKQGIEYTLLEWPAEYPELKLAATNVQHVLRMRRDGWPVPNIQMRDARGSKWELSNQKGELTYVLCVSLNNPSSLKELEFFRRWHKTFGKDIDFVVISLDESYPDYQNYVQKHRDDKFPMLFGGDNPNLAHVLGIAALPFAMLIDDQLNSGMSHTPLPSEGAERTLQQWIQRANRNKK
jgi:hypothetical protein